MRDLATAENERVSQSRYGTDLVLNLFRKTFISTYKNLNCYFFLSESYMHYGSEKCVGGLWLVAL